MQFVAPKDWPKDGEIDLNIHDLPHQSSTTEWWYVNSHCKGKDGKEYSVFASFLKCASTLAIAAVGSSM